MRACFAAMFAVLVWVAPARAQDTASLASRVRELAHDGKLAEARSALAELEKRSASSPEVRAARGLVRFHERRFRESLADLDLAVSSDGGDVEARRALALVHFHFGRWDQARAVAGASDDAELATIAWLARGPFAERWPLAHAALEQRSPSGRYSIVSDLGVDATQLDKLEKDLEALPESRRPALIASFQKNLPCARELSRVFDSAWKAYSKLFKVEKDDGRVFRVYVLATRAEFDELSRRCGVSASEDTLGYFVRPYRFVAFYDERGRSVGALPPEMHRTLFHEAFHQFLDLNVESAPAWFNEGLAEYFAASELRADGLHYGLAPLDRPSRARRLADIRKRGALNLVVVTVDADSKAPPPPRSFLKLLVTTSREEFEATEDGYAYGWGLVHLLASNEGGRKRLRAYYRGLHDGADREQLARALFDKVSDSQLEDAFWSHVDHLKDAPRAGEE